MRFGWRVGVLAFVFTAGIGENSPQVRKGICDNLSWLGVALDDDANAQNAVQIGRDGSKPRVYVIPTDEERMIAMHTLEIVGTSAAVFIIFFCRS